MFPFLAFTVTSFPSTLITSTISTVIAYAFSSALSLTEKFNVTKFPFFEIFSILFADAKNTNLSLFKFSVLGNMTSFCAKTLPAEADFKVNALWS